MPSDEDLAVSLSNFHATNPRSKGRFKLQRWNFPCSLGLTTGAFSFRVVVPIAQARELVLRYHGGYNVTVVGGGALHGLALFLARKAGGRCGRTRFRSFQPPSEVVCMQSR